MFVSKLKFSYDKYSMHKVWMKICCHFYFRGITLNMISSPFCAVSVSSMFVSLTRRNANRCYSLRNTYLISKTFQIRFPTASLIFTVVKLFHEVIWEVKCLHFVISHMRQNKKQKQTLESVQYRLEISFKGIRQDMTCFEAGHRLFWSQGPSDIFMSGSDKRDALVAAMGWQILCPV